MIFFFLKFTYQEKQGFVNMKEMFILVKSIPWSDLKLFRFIKDLVRLTFNKKYVIKELYHFLTAIKLALCCEMVYDLKDCCWKI